MSAKLNIDRHFLFLHGSGLATFTDRVLRNMQHNPYIARPEEMWVALTASNESLYNALNDVSLKRKGRTEVLRAREAGVLIALNRMADYVEISANFKSDVTTTGFRAQTEHRKPMETKRHQRMSVKMARLMPVG